jgi:hypothetical protein
MPSFIPQAISDKMPNIYALLGFPNETTTEEKLTPEQLAAIDRENRQAWFHRTQGAMGFTAALYLCSADITHALLYFVAFRLADKGSDFVYDHRHEAKALATWIAKPAVKFVKEQYETVTKADETSNDVSSRKKAM